MKCCERDNKQCILREKFNGSVIDFINLALVMVMDFLSHDFATDCRFPLDYFLLCSMKFAYELVGF